jgi:hypothetical protein
MRRVEDTPDSAKSVLVGELQFKLLKLTVQYNTNRTENVHEKVQIHDLPHGYKNMLKVLASKVGELLFYYYAGTSIGFE